MILTLRKTISVVISASCVAVTLYALNAGWFATKTHDGDAAWSAVNEGAGIAKVPTALQSGTEQPTQLIDVDLLLRMLNAGPRRFQLSLNEMNRKWDMSYVPMILESVRFLPPRQRAAMLGTLSSKTGQQHGLDFDQWYEWLWKQQYEPHPQYGQFKASLYQRIDPRFSEYFQNTDNATIRLDEIRWGGVVRDGIPPLKNPKMLTVAEATYLGDNDVVFGIELNGDARCYPKRILAWHEMFKDTIGGESVCGVY